MQGFDCGQCGGQCDTCRRAEQEYGEASRRRAAWRQRRATIGGFIKWCIAPFCEAEAVTLGGLLLVLAILSALTTAERVERAFAIFDLITTGVN
jgi:hypothetical protein